MAEKKPILLTWWPVIALAITIVGTNAVGSYRLNQAESVMRTKVDKATHKLIYAGLVEKQKQMAQDIQEIKQKQQQNIEIRIQQQYIKREIRDTKQQLNQLKKEIQTNFDDIKGMLRNGRGAVSQ